jgi:hypothetical protein
VVSPSHVKAATNIKASAWAALMTGIPDAYRNGARRVQGSAVAGRGRERGQSEWTRCPSFHWQPLLLTA